MNTSLMNGGSGASGGAEAKVSVAVRVRPLIERETKQKEGAGINWVVDQNFIQQASPNTDEALPGVMPYMFDHVFSMEDDTKEVYNTVVSPIVDQAFSGFNGTVLCYGQTSSGKTFTLYGSERENGILSLTARHLFKRISEDKDRTYMVRLGLIEIYNEKVSDLLSAQQKEIAIVEINGCIVPKELEEIEIFKPEDMLAAMQQVQKRRRVGETRMNQDSSRSHTIMRILLESVPKAEEIQENVKVTVTTALLNFVDLAGSEKVSQTCAVGERFKEATHINRSLSVLSQVVMQLSQDEASTTGSHLPSSVTPGMSKVGSSITNSSNSTTKKTTSKYVNYRDSKLTRILQSSLSGNAYIAMICTVTPASIEETISTLRFARTAKKIQTKPKANHKLASDSEYQQKILDLQQTLDSKTYELQSKTNEVDDLKRRLEIFMKFSAHPRVLESQNPSGQAVPTLDMRRKTICSSLLPTRDQITLPCLSLQSITEDGIFQIPNKPPPMSKKRSSCGDFSSPFQSEKFMTDEQARNLLDKGEKTRLEEFTYSSVTKKPKFIETGDAESQTDPEPYISEAKRLRLEGTHPPGTPPSVLRLQRSHLRLACEEEIQEKAFHSKEIDVLHQQVSILEEALAASEAKCKGMQEIFDMFSEGNSALLTELKNSIERETQDASTETQETEIESRRVATSEFGVMVGVPLVSMSHPSTETDTVELSDFGANVGTSLLNRRDSRTETAKIEQPDSTEDEKTEIPHENRTQFANMTEYQKVNNTLACSKGADVQSYNAIGKSVCCVCPKKKNGDLRTFTTASFLNHFKTQHSTYAHRFTCPFCSVKRESKLNFASHIVRVHRSELSTASGMETLKKMGYQKEDFLKEGEVHEQSTSDE